MPSSLGLTSGKVINHTPFFLFHSSEPVQGSSYSWNCKLIFIAAWEYLAFQYASVYSPLLENLKGAFS